MITKLVTYTHMSLFLISTLSQQTDVNYSINAITDTTKGGLLIGFVRRCFPFKYSRNEIELFPFQAWPYFLLFMLVENLILWLEKKPTYRLNDSLTSISNGLIQEIGRFVKECILINESSPSFLSYYRLVFRGAESWAYVFVYENFRLIELPWNYTLTWCLAALGVDFCYYWVHRACHGKFVPVNSV